MVGIIRLALPAAGVLFLIFTRKRWMKNLAAPMSFGRWFSASCWLVLPAALFFVGLAVERKRMFSTQGLAVVFVILIGIWGITGFPTVFLGVFKAIKSRKIRESYAQTHGLKYFSERIDQDFFPKTVPGSTNPILTNILIVTSGIYIACTVREKRGTRSREMRGKDIVGVEGVSVRGTIGAIRREKSASAGKHADKKPRNLPERFDDRKVDIDGSQYIVSISERLKDFLNPPDANKATVAAAKETVQSFLHMIAQQGSGLLEEVSSLHIHDDHMVLELKGFLDSEEKLDSWVSCAKRISEWSPPTSKRSSRP